MKYCPNCQTRYTDDTLKFCLQDGTPLAADSEDSLPTVAFDEAETVVTPKQVERLPVDTPEAYAQNLEQSRETRVSPVQTAPPRKSGTLPVVLLTALATLLLGAAGIAAWLYLRNNRNEVAGNTVSNNQVVNSNSNTKSNAKNSPSLTATPKNQLDANAVNANANSTPFPAIDTGQVKKEISSRIDSWIDLTESRNINDYMNHYATTVDYYNKRDVSAAYIRGDKQRAFSDFDSIDMDISNLSVTPDASGERATAVFDKEWVFEGEEKYSAGKVQTQLQLRKINGQWLITGERDLKVYYTE